MPSPRDTESRQEFINRCMADEEAREDFPDEAQRFQFCQSQWEREGNSERGRSAAMEVKSVPFECKVDVEQRLVEGYASTWDRDQIDDIIEPGAFQKTLRERSQQIKVLWQHMDPLGKPQHMEEDSTGLFTRSRISKTSLGDDALTYMADGVVDSMSIGFSIPDGKAEFESDGWTRRIKEVKLYEYSMVTFACNEAAVITGLKQLYETARKHGRDQFGHRADELRRMIDGMKALLDGDEPPDGTRPGQQPPSGSGDDPQADLASALQSLTAEARAFSLDNAMQQLQRGTKR